MTYLNWMNRIPTIAIPNEVLSSGLQLIACLRSFDMGTPHSYPGACWPPLAPVFFGLTFHRWRFRIFDLEPMRRPPRAIGRAKQAIHWAALVVQKQERTQ
jgi:hypothetical protein